ncbi:MAG: HAD hydrolase-like protein, partial [Pseudomonadota bacterium]
GDSARAAMFRGVVGSNVYFIGQDHDHSFFEPLDLIDDPVTMKQVPLAQADGIVCCGPFDPLADPDTYRADFLYAKTKGMKLLCANPDIVVDRGENREWCAGALAQLYTEMGGESLYFGKPHPPIYDLARRRLRAMGKDIPDDRILCVGDGIITDVRGAIGESLDSLYITGGLARTVTKTQDQPDAAALKAHLAQEMMSPTYAIGALR